MPDTTVQLPDGRNLLIPEGTTPDQMAQLRNTLSVRYANPKTGEGMMEAAGAKEQSRIGQPVIQAAEEHAARQAKLGERMNRAGNSATPFTNAIAAMEPIGTAKMLAGSKIGSYLGERAAPVLTKDPQAQEYIRAGTGLLGGLAGSFNPTATGERLSKLFRDPETGKVTISPTAIAERVIPQRPEIAAKEAAEARNAQFDQKAQDLMERQKQQDVLDAAHESRLKQAETERQQELADTEKLKEQHAQSIMRRGKEQTLLDKQYIQEGKPIPLIESPYAERYALNAADKEPVPLKNSPYATQHEAAQAFAEGKEGPNIPLMRSPAPGPENPSWRDATRMNIPFAGEDAGMTPGVRMTPFSKKISAGFDLPSTVPERTSLPGAGGEAWSMQRKMSPQLQQAVATGDPGAIEVARRLSGQTYNPIIIPKEAGFSGRRAPEAIKFDEFGRPKEKL